MINIIQNFYWFCLRVVSWESILEHQWVIMQMNCEVFMWTILKRLTSQAQKCRKIKPEKGSLLVLIKKSVLPAKLILWIQSKCIDICSWLLTKS